VFPTQSWATCISAHNTHTNLEPLRFLEPVVTGISDKTQDVGMEEHCLGQRVFVYDLPKEFYGGTFECLQGQWGTEVLLHQYFRHNCKTEDPEQADTGLGSSSRFFLSERQFLSKMVDGF